MQPPAPEDAESCLILFAKVPVAGQVKTRLCPPLTPEQAARLYEGFLADVIAAAAALPGSGPAVRLALAGSLPGKPERAVETFAQIGADLGERLQRAFAGAFARGFRRVVIRNSDSPALPVERVESAFTALEDPGIDCVLGPDCGGGYYLVGLSRHAPELFERMTEWPAPEVFERTLATARQRGLATVVLPEEPDVDVPEDLERLTAALQADPDRAPCTARVLKELIDGQGPAQE